MPASLRSLVESLCSPACAGRATGTPGGAEARRIVTSALREAGCDPIEQPLPLIRGANVLATIPGDIDRYVLVAAHYDHLGVIGADVYHGADDNAAAVAMLVEVARNLAARRPTGRGVVIAAFDAEEPPYFSTGQMGSQSFVRAPTVPLDRIDLMVCLELLGHALGPPELPEEVRRSVFLLGAERSEGTSESVDAIANAEPGLFVRRADGEVIPPLSDYVGFWEAERPWVLLTNGRSRHYHTPEDLPATLDYAKVDATARWLERFVRASCARDAAPFVFHNEHDDASTLRSIIAITTALAPVSDLAAMGLVQAQQLLAVCDAKGRVANEQRGQIEMLVGAIEQGLA